METCIEKGESVLHIAKIHWWHNLLRCGIPNRRQTLIFTDCGVVLKRGVFAHRIDRIAYAHIESEATYSSLLGRLLGFGHLQLTVSGGDRYQFGNLARIDRVRNALAVGMSQTDMLPNHRPPMQGLRT